MYCYVKDQFAYIKVPKNGCSTYGAFFESNRWTKTDLFYNNLDIDNTVFFGHISEPNQRHTRGLAQYLINTNQVPLINHELSHLLISGVFDEHCYSIHMMIPHLINKVHWIPLDYQHRHFDGTFLTNRFFKQHNLNLHYNDTDRLNVADGKKQFIYKRINELKLKYDQDYQKLIKNFLEPDIKLHSSAIDMYNHIDLDAN